MRRTLSKISQGAVKVWEHCTPSCLWLELPLCETSLLAQHRRPLPFISISHWLTVL